MRLGFWNVVGLRNKNEDTWEYLESFDFIGLVETRTEEKEWKKWEKKVANGFV